MDSELKPPDSGFLAAYGIRHNSSSAWIINDLKLNIVTFKAYLQGGMCLRLQVFRRAEMKRRQRKAKT